MYFFLKVGTLLVGAAAQRAGVVGSVEHVARAVRDCFGHVAQRGAFRRYLLGLLSDSRRKSMSGPGSYEAFQHFMTEAPWTAEHVWRRLRAVIPDREGVLILDGTSFPKQGSHSVGVARQYCGTLGKVANCQVAVTVALWTGARAWMLGARLYLPAAWLTSEQRQRARIPGAVTLQEKWRLALTLLRQVRRSGIRVTAVLGDAEFGDNATLRRTLHRATLPYALGVSSTLTVFPGTPAVRAPVPLAGKGRPRTQRLLASGIQHVAVSALAAERPAYITADAGGSNGYRSRVWKAGLQRLADQLRIAIHVSPLPARHQQVEQDRAPTVLPHHAEPARAPAPDVRNGGGGPDRAYADHHGSAGQSESPQAPPCHRRRRQPGRDARLGAASACVSWGLEL